MRIPYFLAATIFAATFSSATAQSVTTAPVGAVTTTLGVGITPLGISLVNPDLIATSVVSANGPTLTLNVNIVGSALSADEPYYLEVYSGDLKGDRFEVDVAATIANNDTTVVLQPSNPENTFNTSSIGTLLDGESVRIRKHVTIEQLHQSMSSALVGSNSAVLADQIQTFDSNSNGYISYFLRGDGMTWRRIGSTAVVNKHPIYPGHGVFFYKNATSTNISIVGSVRTNDFVRKYTEGLQLLANPWPVDFSPSDYQAITNNGWMGSNSALSADQIQVFNPEINGYESYYLRSDGVTWRKVGTTSVVTNTKLVSADSCFFAKRAYSDPGFLYINNMGL